VAFGRRTQINGALVNGLRIATITYATFHIGVDEFGEEFEIRCEVLHDPGRISEAEAGASKRWFTPTDCELQPMGSGRFFHPNTGAIITLRSHNWT
jgi:hypothetical protein